MSLSRSRKERFRFEGDSVTFPINARAPSSFTNNRSSASPSPVNLYRGHRGWLSSRWGSGRRGLGCSSSDTHHPNPMMRKELESVLPVYSCHFSCCHMVSLLGLNPARSQVCWSILPWRWSLRLCLVPVSSSYCEGDGWPMGCGVTFLFE